MSNETSRDVIRAMIREEMGGEDRFRPARRTLSENSNPGRAPRPRGKMGFYKIDAWNTEALYFWGSEEQAQWYADYLNYEDNREINLYTADPIPRSQWKKIEARGVDVNGDDYDFWGESRSPSPGRTLSETSISDLLLGRSPLIPVGSINQDNKDLKTPNKKSIIGEAISRLVRLGLPKNEARAALNGREVNDIFAMAHKRMKWDVKTWTADKGVDFPTLQTNPRAPLEIFMYFLYREMGETGIGNISLNRYEATIRRIMRRQEYLENGKWVRHLRT